MTDAVTILGICLVDDKFRAAFLKDPIRTTRDSGFRLTAYEAQTLAELAKTFSKRPDVLAAFGTIHGAIRDTDLPRTQEGMSQPGGPQPVPCCPTPPCFQIENTRRLPRPPRK